MKRSGFLKALFVVPAIPFIKEDKEDLKKKYNDPKVSSDVLAGGKDLYLRGKIHINNIDIVDIIREVAKQEMG